ncbi:hypothetical protein PCANC_17484 [Puccinia coronata f. sp. avenae]|uniref:Uncharacterized protein n=1 Tax=Puccinia coronata f. sp. avenae TaxID=200324 RepID=A0A2N5SS68_9BASI|nr:hypothetical protein PCANC_17484 [Puccinia coronata f. sp. avenae]
MDPATTKEVRQYADLVIHRFEILFDRLRDARLVDGDYGGSSLADDFFEASTDSLKATLLPLLRDLVTKMQLCLDPTCLSENPVPTLQLILDIQPQLEDTFLQIKHATALRSGLYRQIIMLIQESQRSIVGLGLSYPHARSPDVWMLERKSTALKVIDFAIVAQSLLPIIKLSRLFFNKLSTYGKQSLPFFTEMHSDQLKPIQNLPCRVLSALRKFLKHLGLASSPERIFPRLLLAKTTKLLKASCEPSLVIISHHFILLAPDAYSSAGQNSFKNWYVTWYNHFNLAMQNLKNIICS